MKINFFSEDVALPKFNKKSVIRVLVREVVNNGFAMGKLNYIFCSDSYLLDLNNRFLKHDYYTDVITFDYTEYKLVSGDIYISTDMVKYNALRFQQEFMVELFRVISHGLLHLLKYNDKEKEEIELMRKMENEMVLRILSFKE